MRTTIVLHIELWKPAWKCFQQQEKQILKPIFIHVVMPNIQKVSLLCSTSPSWIFVCFFSAPQKQVQWSLIRGEKNFYRIRKRSVLLREITGVSTVVWRKKERSELAPHIRSKNKQSMLVYFNCIYNKQEVLVVVTIFWVCRWIEETRRCWIRFT